MSSVVFSKLNSDYKYKNKTGNVLSTTSEVNWQKNIVKDISILNLVAIVFENNYIFVSAYALLHVLKKLQLFLFFLKFYKRKRDFFTDP